MMLSQLSVLVFIAFAVNARAPSKMLRGKDVDDGDYPYYVQIKYYSDTVCGGSIINKRYILTAAHCLENREVSEFRVLVGAHSEFEKTYEVEDVIKYGNYDEGGYQDVGLMRTSEDITFNEKVKKIELSEVDYQDGGTIAEVVGYGITDLNYTLPTKLQQADIKIVNHQRCETDYPRTVKDRRWICGLSKTDKGICFGDSGSPLVANLRQIGIAAHGKVCIQGKSFVFTRISHYLTWIQSNASL